LAACARRGGPRGKRRNIGTIMKHLLVALFIAAIAGVEFHHEWYHSDIQGGVCLAPESQKIAINDLLIQHLRSH
jgi:hypothetical protein